MRTLGERLAAARAQRDQLYEVVRGAGGEGGRASAPFRGAAAVADEQRREQELELARVEGELGWLRDRVRDRLGARRAARWLRWTVVGLGCALAGSVLTVALTAAVMPAPPPPARPPSLMQRRAAFVTRQPAEQCLAQARLLLTKPRAGLNLEASEPDPASLRVFAWDTIPDPPWAIRAALLEDEGWRYAVAARGWYGQTLVTLAGRNQACAPIASCDGPRAACVPSGPDRDFDLLASWLRAACDGTPATDRAAFAQDP